MKRQMASNVLKILLILFGFGVIFFGTYVLPRMANEMSVFYPELEYAKMTVLGISELLLGLLILGIVIIMSLLKKFDQNNTFTFKFTKGLEILVGLCVLASVGLIGLFLFLYWIGGPGPLLSLIMIGLIFIIWIVSAVIMLIRSIVIESMTYKDDYDLTV